MIILALDTAAVDCGACVYDTVNEAILGRVVETIGKGHAERLIGIMDAALQMASLSPHEIDRIAVNIGPGSFTGIRIGVSAARALALAVEAECVGVGALAAIAAQYRIQVSEEPLLATIDARRGEVYAEVFSADGISLSAPAAYPYEALEALCREYGAVAVGTGAQASGLGVATFEDNIRIETVALLGGGLLSSAAVSPLYLRAPDAKPQVGFSVARV